MKNQKLASRYASSLLSLASEHKRLQEVYQDMQLIDSLIKQTREFDLFLKSPIIKVHQKTKVVRHLFKGRVNDLTERFIELLIKNSREIYLSDVVESFVHLYDLKKHIKTAFITTAHPLNESNLKKLKEITALIKADHVKLVLSIDESLIGGFKLKIDDYLIDASLSNKLNEVRRDFGKNMYVPEL